MRLSICIPVYNQEVSALVENLHQQAQQLSCPVEIMIYDDASDNEYIKAKNEKLAKLELVSYRAMPVNLGRSAIRNQLATAANGTHFLFLDDDCQIIEDDFLLHYERQRVHPVVCGGRVYPKDPPSPDHLLHWLYGTQKESKSASERNKQAVGAFHSNNFLIQKVVFDQFQFDENLTQYGHEDTLFGFQLDAANVDIQHIDNPVRHGRLETNQEFLQKTRLAVENLKILLKTQPDEFADYVRLLKHFKRIRQLKMEKFVAAQYRSRKDIWEENLCSAQPSLRVLNWYKLGYLCAITKGN